VSLYSFNAQGNTGDPSSAQDQYVNMTRDQWTTYMNTFVPLENKLNDYAISSQAAPDAMRLASQNVDRAFTAQEGSTDRQLRGMGVTLDADQRAAQIRETGISKALADVHAQSTARDLTLGRQQTLLGNPAPNFGVGRGM
jgi:hypothetical protein